MTESIHKTGRLEMSANTQEGTSAQNARQMRPTDDDRYPGSFFRVPGVPKPGKTTWSLTK